MLWQVRRGLISGRGALDAASGGGASYTGPGDVVGSALGWWGLRAYTAASIGSNAVELRESGGNTTQTFATIAGGGLDLAAIAAFKGANNLFVRTLYDQTPNGHHWVQTTNFFQPAFILSGSGSLPVMRFDDATGTTFEQTLSSGAVSQPFTVSVVGKRTGAFTTEQYLGGTVISGAALWGYRNVADGAYMHAGANGVATATDSAWHSLQFVFNGSLSDINVDGSANTVNPGTNSMGAQFALGAGAGQGGRFTGDVVEQGLWSATAFSGTQSTNMDTNQSGYWGY